MGERDVSHASIIRRVAPAAHAKAWYTTLVHIEDLERFESRWRLKAGVRLGRVVWRLEAVGLYEIQQYPEDGRTISHSSEQARRQTHLEEAPPEKASMTLDLLFPRLTPFIVSCGRPERLRVLAPSMPLR